jgi:hypothetical protein
MEKYEGQDSGRRTWEVTGKRSTYHWIWTGILNRRDTRACNPSRYKLKKAGIKGSCSEAL